MLSLVVEPSAPFVPEGGRTQLTITREGNLDLPVSVKYRTIDGTAKASERDYTPIITETVYFRPGEREISFYVFVLDDFMPETDETFFVELYDPTPEGKGKSTKALMKIFSFTLGLREIRPFPPLHIKMRGAG